MNTSRAFHEAVVGVCFVLANTICAFGEVSERAGTLTVTGTVTTQDGTPAAEAHVESWDSFNGATIHVRADRQGRFQLNGRFGNGCRLHVRSSDGTQQATLLLSAAEARTRLARHVDFNLLPTRDLAVRVSSPAGDPVVGAHVTAEGSASRSSGVTGADGAVKLRWPADDQLAGLVAWHATLGAAGKLDKSRRLEGDSFQLALLPSKPHTIRVVDADGQPVGDLSFGVSLTVKGLNWIAADEIEAARLRTDANGEVTAAWFPQDILFVNARIGGDHWKVDDTERDRTAEGYTTIHVRRKVAVTGRLKMPEGISAEGIVVSGFGFGPKSTGDAPAARATADGTFTLSVAPDHGYALSMSDTEWASDGWSGLILADEKAEAAKIAMDVYRATPLEVRVARGEGHQGVAGAWVNLRSQEHFSWRNAKGAVRDASGGNDQWVRTDANGVGRLGIGKGTQTLRLTSGDWTEERTITVDSDSPLSVEFYRPWLSKRKITGRLLASSAPHKPSQSATIEAASVEQRYQRLKVDASLQADGTFEVEGDASDVSIFVMDREQQLSGFARVAPKDDAADLELSKMAMYAGSIVDQDGEPHTGKTLRIVVKDTDHQAADDQISDNEGRFKFPLAAANVPLIIQVQKQSEVGPWFRQVGELLFLPGETRNNVRLAVDLRDFEQQRIRSDNSVALAQQVAKAARNARLSGMRAIVFLQGDSSPKVTRLVETVSNYDEQPSVLSYTPLFVDEKLIKSSTATLNELGWPLPQSGEAVLVALDGDAKILGIERLSADNIEAAGRLATALLKKHLPPVRDAQARLDAAREEAQRTGRKLWIVEGGPRCGPCFRLARWMDDQHALLEKDYVIVKVLAGLDEHAEEVIKALNRPESSGIPWFAITDTSGNVLATSEGPLGNMGMPSTLEDFRPLRAMLKQTAQRLTPEELNSLIESLTNFK